MLTAYRAALPGTVLLSSIVAFSLAICCLLAGTNPSTLPNMQLYILNTSKIGPSLSRQMGLPAPDPNFNFKSIFSRDVDAKLDDAKASVSIQSRDIGNAIQNPKGALDSAGAAVSSTVSNGKGAVQSAAAAAGKLGDKLGDKAKNATGEIVSTFINETISTLGIQDFYIAHLLTYCSGRYTSGKSKQDITYCSNGKPNRLHNGTAGANSTKHADGPFDFVEKLHLPDPISWALKAITLLSKVIAVIYIIALITLAVSVVASGLSIPGSITSVTGGSSKLRYASLVGSVTAFLCLLLGSLLVKFMSNKVVNFFAAHEGLGVQAAKGQNFMGVSIAAVVFTGIAVMVALADVIVGRAVGKVARVGEKMLPTGIGRTMGGRQWFGRGKGKKAKKEEWEMDEEEAGLR
ncbi:hypothetical protein G7Y79_00015g038670 [Physcia stellaris]|nr:hypothetical protein G7Y79_00015g038670 [Physcia stellaris]